MKATSSHAWLRASLLLALVLTVGTLSTCSKQPANTACSKDGDCLSGQVCRNSICVAASDAGLNPVLDAGGSPLDAGAAGADAGVVVCDPACTNGEICAGGQCMPPLCAQTACRVGEVCQDDVCVAAACVGVICSTGMACANGKCAPLVCAAVTCDTGQVCQDDVCIDAMCAGVNCPGGQVCAGGMCYAPNCSTANCSASEVCVEGKCTDVRCAGAHCPPGRQCSAGNCQSCPTTETICDDHLDNDCDGKTDCADSDCLGKPCSAPCREGTTCGAGGICQGGTAKACDTAPGECWSAPGTCTMATGVCSYGFKSAGVACATDSNPCTSDICDGAGACTHPAGNDGAACTTGKLCHSGSCVAGCFIGGTFVADQAIKSDNPCLGCLPTQSTTAWSNLTDGTNCGTGMGCVAGSCMASGTCTISTVTYPNGTPNPTNACQRCDISLSTTSWSSRPVGSACPDEPNPCTDDACDGFGTCAHAAKSEGTPCAAGSYCRASDHICVAGCLIAGKVWATGAVNPTNSCESCAGGTAWSPAGEATSCSVDNTRFCHSGTCTLGCSIVGVFYADGAANPNNPCQNCKSASGLGWTNLSNGTGCPDDGNLCTTDACSAGACLHPTAANGTSCGTNQVCLTGSCVACTAGAACTPANPCHSGLTSCATGASTCSDTGNAPDGTNCGSNMVCSAGTCVSCSGGLGCAPTNPCHVGNISCATGVPVCTDTGINVSTGTSCDDGNFCNGVSTCQGGTCTQTTAPVSCNNPPACRTATGANCAPATGACTYPVASDGTNCDDGNLCNGVSTCQGGSCTQTTAPIACNSPPTCHTITGASCAPASGSCSYPGTASNGTDCDDGNLCNGIMTCQTGSCVQTTPPVSCISPPACHVAAGATCDTSSGACNYPDMSDGTSCGTSVICHTGSCVSGCWIGGVFVPPNQTHPTNSCLACVPSSSTTSWSPSNEAGSCNAPTKFCHAGACTLGCGISGVFYADGVDNPANHCQYCNASSNGFVWATKTGGTSCGTNQVCNGTSCQSGCWIGGFYSPLDTNPANVCQNCQPGNSTTSWSNGPPGVACPDDGNACTNDTCNSLGVCTHSAKPDNTGCGGARVCCYGTCSSLTDPCTCGSCGSCCFGSTPYCNGTGCYGPPGCFVAGTPVRMADGTDRPIEKIRAGERVLSYDEAAGRVVASVVTETFRHAAEVTRATLLVNGTLRATPNHPFFANGRWVTAGELGVGDILLEASEDGRTVVRVPVRSIERLPGGVEVFNLEVAGVHDYFADGLLVHNKPLTCSTGCL